MLKQGLIAIFTLALATMTWPPMLSATDLSEALHDAARQGDVEAVKALLEKGADANALNEYGAAALTYAADKGHLPIIKLLVEHGADLDARDTFYKSSALAWASYNNHADSVAFLLEKGASDVDGALGMAINRQKPAVVAAILESGKASAESLSTGLATAKLSQASEIVTLLEKAGVKPPESSSVKLSEKQLQQFLGTFTLDQAPQMEGVMALKEGVLQFTFAGQPALPMEATSPTGLQAQGGFPLTIEYELTPGAKGFMLTQEGLPEPVHFTLKAPPEPEQVTETEQIAEATPVAVPKGAVDVNWPAFRGPNAAGTANGNPPVTWNVETGENILFKIPIPGRGHASPIIWGDRLFIATAVSSEDEGEFRHGLYGDVDVVENEATYSWRIYAYDKQTGKELWRQDVHQGKPRSAHHIKATQANATPVTDGKNLVAILGSEGLYCWDLDGNLKWQADLGDLHIGWFYDPSYQWGHSSSPIIYGDKVIVQIDLNRGAFIAAYSLKDGKQLWRTERDNLPSWGSPTVLKGKDRVELVTNGSRLIRGYDPETGKELWNLGPNAEVTVGTPVVWQDTEGQETAFVTASYQPIRPIYAIRVGGKGDISLAEGQESSETVVWKTDRGGTYIPTPIVYGDHLYLNSMNGVLSCHDVKTGERLYRERIAGSAGAAFTASPVAAAGRLYFSSEDGEVYVSEVGENYKLLATNDMAEVIMATPAISDDTLYIRTLGHLVAIAAPPKTKSEVVSGQ